MATGHESGNALCMFQNAVLVIWDITVVRSLVDSQAVSIRLFNTDTGIKLMFYKASVLWDITTVYLGIAKQQVSNILTLT